VRERARRVERKKNNAPRKYVFPRAASLPVCPARAAFRPARFASRRDATRKKEKNKSGEGTAAYFRRSNDGWMNATTRTARRLRRNPK
jgi:hypothetical protein